MKEEFNGYYENQMGESWLWKKMLNFTNVLEFAKTFWSCGEYTLQNLNVDSLPCYTCYKCSTEVVWPYIVCSALSICQSVTYSFFSYSLLHLSTLIHAKPKKMFLPWTLLEHKDTYTHLLHKNPTGWSGYSRVCASIQMNQWKLSRLV